MIWNFYLPYQNMSVYLGVNMEERCWVSVTLIEQKYWFRTLLYVKYRNEIGHNVHLESFTNISETIILLQLQLNKTSRSHSNVYLY